MVKVKISRARYWWKFPALSIETTSHHGAKLVEFWDPSTESLSKTRRRVWYPCPFRMWWNSQGPQRKRSAVLLTLNAWPTWKSWSSAALTHMSGLFMSFLDMSWYYWCRMGWIDSLQLEFWDFRDRHSDIQFQSELVSLVVTTRRWEFRGYWHGLLNPFNSQQLWLITP